MANIFEETANNEKEHAKIWFKLLEGGSIKSTPENLVAAAEGENEEWTLLYPEFAKVAQEEGFLEVAAAFEMVVNYVATRRYTALTAWSYIRTLLPIATITAIMYGAIMAEANYIAEWSVGVRLAVKIVTGVVVYIAASAVLRMEALSETITIAKQFLSRKK